MDEDQKPSAENDMTRLVEFTAVLAPQPEGGFTVTIPALPEVVTEGDTEAEALAMAREAIEAVLAYRRENGIEMPGNAEPALRKISVAA
jgi:antitoxin HicB